MKHSSFHFSYTCLKYMKQSTANILIAHLAKKGKIKLSQNINKDLKKVFTFLKLIDIDNI